MAFNDFSNRFVGSVESLALLTAAIATAGIGIGLAHTGVLAPLVPVAFEAAKFLTSQSVEKGIRAVVSQRNEEPPPDSPRPRR